MKKIIALLAIVSSLSVFAGTAPFNGSLSISSTVSEADLVLKAEALIPGIVEFTNKEIRREAAYAGCNTRRPRDIKMGSMRFSKVYKSVDGQTFEPVFFGSIAYTVKGCRDRD